LSCAEYASESDSGHLHERKQTALHRYFAMQYTRQHREAYFAPILSFAGATT
jgi:hypothetical protein